MNYMFAVETVSSKHPRAILIFSKSPEAGNVKTRLKSILGEENCLRLHIAMLKDTLQCCSEVKAAVILYLTKPVGLNFPCVVPTRVQVEGDLGFRMQQAFAETLESFQSVIIVGTDAPGLTPDILRQAFDALGRHEFVLGPSSDGGYYLIGLNRMIPGIFEDIPWSTPEVLRLTLSRKTACLLPELYDIDVPEDLGRLRNELDSMPCAHYTRLLLNSI